MSIKFAWQEQYQAAMLELCPEELRRRIDDAEKAIHRRIAALQCDDAGFGEESRALQDALRSLRILANSECAPPVPTPITSTSDKAAS